MSAVRATPRISAIALQCIPPSMRLRLRICTPWTRRRPEYAAGRRELHAVWSAPDQFLTKREMDQVGLEWRYPASDDRRYSGARMTDLFDLLQRKRTKKWANGRQNRAPASFTATLGPWAVQG
jgi:hypothetical protein